MKSFWVVIIALLMTAPVVNCQKSSNKSKENDKLTATIKTDKGEIKVELFGSQTPLTVANFVNLSRRGYFDGIKFHRVISGFMIQGGDPTGTGSGSPGYRFEDEFSPTLKHDSPGILSMANAGPGTNGSQFFITHVPTPHLDSMHSVFGKVINDRNKDGQTSQDVVDAIRQGDKITTIIITGEATPEMKAVQNRIDKFNAVLDRKFPKLKKAEKL